MATTGAGTRDRILDAAQRLVLARGFAATTVDGVLTAAGVSKGSFFHHFPSKAHLGRALVERYAAADQELLRVHLAAAEAVSGDPAVQLVELMRSLETAADEVADDAQPGCLFISFIYESELTDAGTEEIVAGAIRHWRERLLDKLEKAAAASPPGWADIDLPALADHVFATIEGAFLLARALGDPACVRRQIVHLRHYLELLFGPAPGKNPPERGVGAATPG